MSDRFASAGSWRSRVPGRFGDIEGLLRGGFGRWLGVAILFSVATVVQTWPLVLHATDSIVDIAGGPNDSYQSLWNLWWVNHALVELRTNPFQTDLLFFPGGADLYGHTLTIVNGVLSIPLQRATGNLILSANVLGLAFFVFSGLGMYALSYRVNRNHAAALISGYIFAFSPFIVMHFHGQWNLSTTWPIPLFALFLLRFQDSGRIREAAAAAILWVILTYNNLEYGVWAGLFLALFFTYWSFTYLRQGDRARLLVLWRGFAVTTGVWLIMMAPLLIPTLLWLSNNDVPMPQNDEFYSSDLRALVTPSPLWGPGKSPPFCCVNLQHVSAGSLENTAFLGFVPLILAGLALFAIRRTPHRVIFWLVIFLLFLTLAMGPTLFIGDTKTFSVLGVSFSVPLPYRLLDQIPLIGSGRVPARMIVFSLVGLALLAGTGFDVLTSWLRPRYKKLVPLAAVIVLSLVVLEYWNPPANLIQLSPPAILEKIRDEPGDFTILDAPWGRGTGAFTGGHGEGAWLTNYYQTIHEKPSLGGAMSRASMEDFSFGSLGTDAGVGYFARFPPEQLPQDQDSEEVRRVFRELRIKYVLVHRLTPRGTRMGFGINEASLAEYDEYLRTIAGLESIFANASFTVYRNPEVQ